MFNKIAQTRKCIGMTQDKLAKMVGVSRPYLSDIENGKYNPGGELMLKIAKALKINVEEIFFENYVMYEEHNFVATGTD